MGGLLRRVVLVGASLALAALGMPMFGQSLHGSGASQAATTLAIDANPLGNSAASLAGIDSCVSVAAGETFDVDVVVTDVTDLSGWQAQFVYDGSVVAVVATDTELFLAAEPGSALIDLSPDPLPDTDGAYGIIVADMSQTMGENGSGVLARLTLQAVGQGASALNLSQITLGDSAARAIGDIDGDDLFDGPISGAQIWVDQPCPSEPLPTLTPPTPLTATPPATPLAPGASPTAAETLTPWPPAVGQSVPASLPTEEEGGFPWAIVSGASAGAVVAALALAFVVGRSLRRG